MPWEQSLLGIYGIQVFGLSTFAMINFKDHDFKLSIRSCIFFLPAKFVNILRTKGGKTGRERNHSERLQTTTFIQLQTGYPKIFEATCNEFSKPCKEFER